MMDMEQNNGGTLLPVGTVIAFAGRDIPRGWMLCDGTALSRAIYDRLFAVIRTDFGADDDATFRLPDLRPPAPGIRYLIHSGNLE